MKRLISAVACAAFLSGCATGKTITQSEKSLPPVAEGMGRIVVYRTGLLGAAVQPTVSIAGAPKGKCTPNGAFLVDVAPGDHVVSAKTEVMRETLVHVTAGQSSYVRCSIGMGFFIGQPQLEIVSPGTGKLESDKLVFTGKY
jgi:hypothetical protein